MLLPLKTFFWLIVFILTPFWFFSLSTFLFSPSLTYTSSPSLSQTKIALVLGAGLFSGRPGLVLQKRLDKALELYKAGWVKRILVSGDNRELDYNEPQAMQDYLLENGVAVEHIIQDFAGRRTIDSCWRAKNVFKIDKLIIITQSFHLPRADYLCRSVGLKTWPIVAQDSTNNVILYGLFREIPAAWVSVWEALTKYEAPIKSDGKEENLSY